MGVEKQGHVVCVGQALVDCITRGMEEKPYKKNVYRAESITLNTGGDALNESIVLSHLGHRVSLMCGLGKDIPGQMILHTAKENGVDVSCTTVSEELSTPIANLMVQKDGNRQSVNSLAAMETGYVPEERAFGGAKVVSFASLFRAPLDRKENVLRLMKAAKKEGAIVCADTKMPIYRNISGEDIREILPYIDYMFPNENEAYYYSHILTEEASGASVLGKNEFVRKADISREGQEQEEQTLFLEMGKKFCQHGVQNVIIKTGEKGCIAVNESEIFHVPARKVKAVDSTGAGDNFVAGFIHGILNDWDLTQCCDYGTQCAALSVQYVGAVTGISRHGIT